MRRQDDARYKGRDATVEVTASERATAAAHGGDLIACFGQMDRRLRVDGGREAAIERVSPFQRAL